MQQTKRINRFMALFIAVVMLLAMMPMSAMATNTMEPVSISTGDSIYIAWNGTTGTVTGYDGSTSIPATFTLWVEGTSSITVDGTTQAYTYFDTTDGVTNYAFTIETKSTAITIVAVSSGTTYTVTCPAKSTTAAGASPSSVVSYLPIGQYASGSGWGSATGKFAGKTALDSTGVSLGALGGYIEFKFDDGISDDPKNPYGVDFVVYGNAFNGNPEAGAVQVSTDGTKWYELAGSKYYDSSFNYVGNQSTTADKFSAAYTGTLRNADVTYTWNSNNKIEATLKNAGGTAMFSNVVFSPSKAWWPTATEYDDSVIAAAHQDSNVTIARSGSTAGSTLAFGGVTAIEDSNKTVDYAFGYADVTPNGSPAKYGNAVNPYTPYTTSKTGGDGFDLAWAVDISTGEPVDVTGKVFKYVRVYSAVLDNGTFGETSTEVCGIFAATGTASTSTATPMATVKVGNTTITRPSSAVVSSTQSFQTVPIGANDSVSISSGAAYVYVNGELVTATNASPYVFQPALSSGEQKTYQIITQTSDRAAYVRVITFTGT